MTAPSGKRAVPDPPVSAADASEGTPPRKKRRARSVRPKIVILSRKRTLYSTRRLVEATRKLGGRAQVLDTLQCTMLIAPKANQVLVDGAPLRDVAVVIPRIGTSITSYGLAVVNHLDMIGIPILNNSVPIARSRDKLRCLQLLARFDVDVPRTVMAHARGDAAQLVDAVGGLPVIVKLVKGTQGVGVMLASTMQEVRSILETFAGLGEDIVLQEFVAESSGRDVRALVVGDRVVAAMRRQAGGDEFRSNIHRGGTGEAFTLPPGWEEVAVRAARIIGLEVAGVDFLEGRHGPKVTELNSSPGLEGIERTTGVDVAGAIVTHALELSQKARAGWTRPRMI
jgi:ribosomal protein S6--L-glutamate ligase